MTRRSYAAQKAGLTRALRSKDPAKIEAEVMRAVVEWNATGIWPDDWHRWNIALQDATGRSID